MDGLGVAGCACGAGVTGADDGSTLVGMAIAKVIGEVVCVVTVVGGAGETSTMRAVLVRVAPGGDSGLGAGFSPWISSFRSSRVCIRPLMTARLRVTSALSAVRILKFRWVWNS